MTRRRNAGEHGLRGTQRPDRDRREPEPHPVPLQPCWLPQGRAQALWRTHAPTLASLGLLTPLDAEGFGTWCAVQAQIEAQIAAGETPGRDSLTTVRSLAARYGLDPDSRARILGTPPAAPPRTSKFDDV